jgi:hypothetical protein
LASSDGWKPAQDDPAVGPGDLRHGQAEHEQEDRQAEQPEDERRLKKERLPDRDEEGDEGDPDDGPEDLLGHEMEGLAEPFAGHEARGAEDEEDAGADEDERRDKERHIERGTLPADHRRPPAPLSPAARRRTSVLKVRPRSSKSANISQLVQAGARRTTSPRAAAAKAERTTSR